MPKDSNTTDAGSNQTTNSTNTVDKDTTENSTTEENKTLFPDEGTK